MPGLLRARRATSRQPCPAPSQCPCKNSPSAKARCSTARRRPRRLHRPAPAAQDGSEACRKMTRARSGKHPAIPTVFFFSLRGPLRGSGSATSPGFFKQSGGGQHTIIHSQQGLPDSPPCDRPHLPASHSTPPAKDWLSMSRSLPARIRPSKSSRTDRRDSLFRHKRMDAFTQTGASTPPASRCDARGRRTLGEGTWTAALPKVVEGTRQPSSGSR